MLLAALAGPAASQGAPASDPRAAPPAREITWVVTDRPPLYILRNGEAPRTPSDLGDGFSDRRLKALIGALPGYTHRFKVLNVGRTWLEMGAGIPECISSALRNPERDKVAYFTPFDMVEGLHVVTREDTRERLAGEQASVSLATLVSRRDLRGTLTVQRSYTTALDAIIAGAPPDRLARVSAATATQYLRMLDLGRMDYTIEYPAVVEAQLRQAPLRHRMALLRIDEVPSTVQTYAACTRGEWGREVIRDIDAAVRKVIAADANTGALSPVLSPEVRRDFAARIEDYRTERVKRPVLDAD